MRLHHLEVQAFGPFPDRVEVDFDRLAESGLFLLTGATGAGKTSVLDAICFALYGDVPGARGVAKRLRCDNAPADRVPQVRMEWSIAGRRFRLTRSPAWQRPKKRGTGTTPEQARVVCEERRDGVWEALSTRLDETGHLVQRLLGMTMHQFCQVALLPQGEFQGFLRARTDERHQLLQQLFATGRYEQIERWVRERARETHRAADAATRDVLSTVGLLAETVLNTPGISPSPIVDHATTTAELGAIEADGALSEWLDDVQAAVHAHDQLSHAVLDDTQGRLRDGQRRLDGVRRTHEQLTRARTARAQLDQLAARQSERADQQSRLEAAREAAGLMPLLQLLARHNGDSARAQTSWEARLGALCEANGALHAPWWPEPPGEEVDPQSATVAAFLQGLRESCDNAVARVRALPQLTERHRVLAGELDDLAASLAELEARQTDLDAEIALIPAELERRSTLVEQLQEASRDHDGLEEQLKQCANVQASIDRLERQEVVLTEAGARVFEARGQVQDARQRWLDLRESRINGMAAELAAGLAAGGACPVCGSADHPEPAFSGAENVSAADEKAARDLLTDLEFALTSAVEEERTVRDEVSGLRAIVAGRSRDEVDAEHTGLVTALATAARGRAELPEAERELVALRATLADHHEAVAETSRAAAALTSRRDALVDEHRRVEAEIGTLVEHYAISDPTVLSRALTSALERINDAAEARTTLLGALRTEHTTREEFESRLAASRFSSRTAVEKAHLTPLAMDSLAESIASDEHVEAVATAVLDEQEVRAALEAEAPDLHAAEEAVHRLTVEVTAAQKVAAHAERCRARADELQSALATRVAAWRPHRDEARAAADLAALVEGKSADNVRRMRLSTYVLAWRLSQVVDAANERLARMTGGRYSLVHAERRANRETRGGLSIEVRDDWSGEEREPATLSGGETFVVSLALALGLADVVAAESGGVSLDTLFVDEGFGSLDAETLDDVLDVLDSLREGGRVIGVVSHVAEMRSRIPAQLQVVKDQAGSRLRVAGVPAREPGSS